MSTSGWAIRGSPASGPNPVTRLATPGGTPASSRISNSRTAVSGVSSAGLTTTVLPQTRAGKSFQAGMSIGRFQGVTIPTTPTGSRIVIANRLGRPDGTTSPNMRRPSPAMYSPEVIAPWTS